MNHDLDRIVGLAEGRYLPASGLEMHFVRVVKGDAMLSSREEAEWLRAYEESRRINDTNPKGFSDDLRQKVECLQAENSSLRRELGLKDQFLKDSESKFHHTLSKIKGELATTSASFALQATKVNELESALELLRKEYSYLLDVHENKIDSKIDLRHREIQQEFLKVVDKNKRLAELIVELTSKFRKENSKRIKCPVCDGQSTGTSKNL